MGPDVHVAIHRLNERASLPSRGSSLAAGWDLRASEGTSIPKGEIKMVSTGLAMALPAGFEAQIRARSGLARRGLIIPNGPGTIDADYRGEIKVLLLNLSPEDPFDIEQGERIAQMVIQRVPEVIFEEVEDLDALGKTSRGEGGFGSTGRQ